MQITATLEDFYSLGVETSLETSKLSMEITDDMGFDQSAPIMTHGSVSFVYNRDTLDEPKVIPFRVSLVDHLDSFRFGLRTVIAHSIFVVHSGTGTSNSPLIFYGTKDGDGNSDKVIARGVVTISPEVR